jgi:class 3 adenylate cyclase
VTQGRRSSGSVRWFGPIAYAALLGAPVLISGGQYAIGPRSSVAMVLYVEVPIFASFLLPRRWAVAVIALVAAEVGAVLALQGGYPLPQVQWFFVAGTLVLLAYVFGSLLNRAVDEAERNQRLARFLAPEVVEVVLSSGSSSLLEPHRRQIAVLFCDLRGFTRFASSSEPEEVVEVLQAYMQTAGALIHELGATVGAFAGDGIMAYFNDPVPCDNPSEKALALANRLRADLDVLVDVWARRGIDLSYGIGIAYGHATLGVFGFEGRNDYTALGSVVNLAARLSDCAAPAEIVLDPRAYAAAGPQADAVLSNVELKGFADPVPAHRLPPVHAGLGDSL